MISIIKRNASLLMTVLFVAGFAVYFFLNKGQFSTLSSINSAWLLLIVVINVAIIAVTGFFIATMLRPFDVRLGNQESFDVALFSTIGNYLTPFRGGAGIRAVYLKKKYKLSYASFASTMYGTYALLFLMNAIVGLFSIVLLRSSFAGSTGSLALLTVVLLGVCCMSIASMFVRVPKVFLERKNLVGKVTRAINKIHSGWTTVASDHPMLKRLAVLIAMNTFLYGLVVFLSAQALGLAIGLAETMLYTSLGSLSLLISVTPGSLGVREAVLVIFSQVIGLSPAEVLSIALIDRGAVFIALVCSYMVRRFVYKTSVSF